MPDENNRLHRSVRCPGRLGICPRKQSRKEEGEQKQTALCGHKSQGGIGAAESHPLLDFGSIQFGRSDFALIEKNRTLGDS